MDIEKGRQALRTWYLQHKRDLPWRKTKDPYRIWLAEIILQQTQVKQGLPYYERFVNTFPAVDELANASQEQVLKLWEGLGYYSRARNLHAAAQSVVRDWGGEFPRSYQGLKNLKGVGPYTAAAVSSFAFGEVQAVVDGNVNRVLSRLHRIKEPVNKPPGQKLIKALADDFIDPRHPADHNQAIMELGATLCRPAKPNCPRCPLKDFCEAYHQGDQARFPRKEKKQYLRERRLVYIFLRRERAVYVQQRKSGIWQGLYQFPLLEGETLKTAAEIEAQLADYILGDLKWGGLHRLGSHRLSHQLLEISVQEIQLDQEQLPFEGFWHPLQDLKDLAFPRPLQKFIAQNQLTLPFD